MGILMEMVLFVGGFLAAFAGYLLHTMLHYALRHGRLNPLSRRMEGVATAIIFCGYAGWGLMIATDPVYLGLPVPIAVFGGIAGVAGVVLLLLAIRGLHGFRGEHQLLSTGIYSKFRHPMYLGIILMHLGFPVLLGCALTLLSAGLWVPQILLWAKWEEEELEEQFGDAYTDYRRKTLF